MDTSPWSARRILDKDRAEEVASARARAARLTVFKVVIGDPSFFSLSPIGCAPPQWLVKVYAPCPWARCGDRSCRAVCSRRASLLPSVLVRTFCERHL